MPTLDEYKQRLVGLTENPDKLQTNVDAIITDLTIDMTTLSTLTEKTKNDEQRIKELQDTNQKLFMKNNAPNTPPPEQDNGDKMLENILKRY